MQSLSAALSELAFLVLYAYPGVRSLTGPYPPGYVPAGLSAPSALSGLVFVIAPWAYSVPFLSGGDFSCVPAGLNSWGEHIFPGLKPRAIFYRPCGTFFMGGYIIPVKTPGYILSSLRDLF